MPLKARLVVLSACDSGSGQLRAREGVMGLARAFLAAGAGAVVATLWPIDDRATRRMTLALHRHVLAGQSFAAALALAQRELRRDDPHPFYWAPFVLLDRAVGGAPRQPVGPATDTSPMPTR